MHRLEQDGGTCHLAIGIATAGRPTVLAAALSHLQQQTRRVDTLILCAPDEADIGSSVPQALAPKLRILISERGLCRQRNRILATASQADILLFLDDDFLMAADYLAQVEHLFRARPDIVMATGTVAADGILGPGIPFADGLDLLDRNATGEAGEVAVYNAYGCNMALRMAPVRADGIAFDENLPLYGWLEDVDFSRRMAAFGGIVRSGRLRGVHLGTKSGRTSGLRLGYSQIANPVYLMRKRTISLRHAATQMARNLAANTVRLPTPEPWVDRRGRLRGNLRALGDLVRGRLAPQNILALD